MRTHREKSLLRPLLLAMAALQASTSAALAADVTVPDGTTSSRNTATSIGGNDQVKVGAGATLTSTANPTLLQSTPATGVVIDNRGTITSSSSGGRAIRFNNGSSMVFTILNGEDAVIRSDNDAIQVNPAVTSGTVVVTNNGLIESRGVGGNNGQGIDFAALGGATSITITNNVKGIIQAADSDAIRTGDGATINNYGQIIGNNFQLNTGADGIDFQTAKSGTVYNYETGVISGGRHGINHSYDAAKNDTTSSITVYNRGVIVGRNGSGVGSDVSTVVYNWGRITGQADNIPGVANGDGDGVDVDYKATIVNYGIIEGKGSKGVGSDGLPNTSEALAIGGGSVINNIGARISGVDNGILVDNSSQGNAFFKVEIQNAGLIEGTRGYGIFIRSAFDNIITNSGTITSGNGKAIIFGSGNDTLNILTGSVITGTVDGGDGVDTVNLSGQGVFAGAINFEKLNVVSGRWRLTGNETYSLGAVVSSGATLVEAGTLNAAVSVQQGATLAGTGTVGPVTLDGDIAPGDAVGSIGMLTVAGGLRFGQGARFLVDATPQAAFDKLFVNGVAVLGGTVVVTAQQGQWRPLTRGIILEARGGLRNTFAGAQTNLAFLTPNLVYGSTTVELVMARNDVRFEDVAVTSNQTAVARAFSAIRGNNTLTFSLLGQTSAGAQAAYDALSGSGLTGAMSNGVSANQLFAAGIMGHATQPQGVIDPAQGGKATAPMQLGMGSVPDEASGRETSRLRLWGQGFNQAGRAGGNAGLGASAENSRQSGFIAGADWKVSGSTVLGFATAGSEGSTWNNDRQTGITTSGYHVGAYGVTRSGGSYIAMLGSFSAFDNISKRTVAAFGTLERERGAFDSMALGLQAEVGQRFQAGSIEMTPFASLGFTRYLSESYTEATISAPAAAGPFALAVAGARADNVPLILGARIGTEFAHPAGWVVRPLASAAWVHNFSNDRRLDASLGAFPGAGFTVNGAKPDADVLQAKLAVGVQFTSQVGAGLELTTEQGAATQTLAASGQVRINW